MKLVMITWHDAHSGGSTWAHIDDLEDDGPYVVRSVGWLLESKFGGKKKHATVAQSISPDGCVDSVLHVPEKMIVEVTVIAEVPNEVVVAEIVANGK